MTTEIENFEKTISGKHQALIIYTLDIAYKQACYGQTKPDGNNCMICGDNDHQAFECKFNAFNIFYGRFQK